MVIARTTEGDVGVLRNHAPLLSLLVDGVVEVSPVDGDRFAAAVDGGFVSVANNRVSILSERAVLAPTIDVEAGARRPRGRRGRRRRRGRGAGPPGRGPHPRRREGADPQTPTARRVCARRVRPAEDGGDRMPVWQWLLDAVGVLLVLVLLYGVALVVRRRLLSRHGGTFELSYRVRSERAGRGWLLGLGRYSGESLEWFRIFSLSPRPKPPGPAP